MDDLIIRLSEIRSNYNCMDGKEEPYYRALSEAIQLVNGINVSCKDVISRQAAIDELYKMLHDCFWADDEELDAVITTLNELPSAQPEDCSTCKHGHFGDRQCDYCGVRYPSHYERDEK